MEEHEAKLFEKLIDAVLNLHEKQREIMEGVLKASAGFGLRNRQTPEIETE
jgi:hypothetical protein